MKTAFVFVVILCFGWQCYAESESFEALATGLPDGVYVIERVNFMPPRRFDNEEEAKAWVEAVKKNLEIVKPEYEYFQLYLSGNDFIIHQLRQRNGGGYESNSNFLVSVSSQASWAFEETANRVTIITNLVELENAGPVTGLLETGASFCKELRNLGLSAIDLSSVKQIENNRLNGKTKQGSSFDGTVQSNAQGQITNILCKVSNAAMSYDLNFDILHNELTKQPTQVTISERQTGETIWHPMLQYAIKDYSSPAKEFLTDTFWEQFTNSATLLVFYDSIHKTTLIHETNGITRPLGKRDVADSIGSDVGHARWVVLIALGVSTILGMIILIRALNHSPKQ